MYLEYNSYSQALPLPFPAKPLGLVVKVVVVVVVIVVGEFTGNFDVTVVVSII